MSIIEFPDPSELPRPRTMSLVADLEKILDANRLDENSVSQDSEGTRPSDHSINGMQCVACREVEYLTREHCRCGHYLRGQLEDEFIRWEVSLQSIYESLSKDALRKLRPLRIVLAMVTIPLIIFPAFHYFWSGATFQWYILFPMAGGALALFIAAFIEGRILRPLKTTKWLVENCTLQTFIEVRAFDEDNTI